MYNEKTYGFNIDAVIEGMKRLPKGGFVLMQTCGNNPTGVDPDEKEWVTMSRLCKDRALVPILDSAYLGLISGNIFKDAYPVRMLTEDGHNFFVTQSFSKNMGLYGERLGAIHIVAANKDEAARLHAQFAYSDGLTIVATSSPRQSALLWPTPPNWSPR